jgi:hypothetical protein
MLITIPKLRIFFLTFLILFLPNSCSRENKEIIPYAYVNFSIRLDNPQFIDLNAIGNSVIVTSSYAGRNSAGYNFNGIIIYRASEDEFYAFDRTCTYQVGKSIAVEIENSMIIAECPECSSKYVLPNLAFPTEESLSKHPLKQYQTHFDGVSVYVYN